MLINKTYEIVSCDDVELGIKRDSLLEFRLTYDEELEPKALVFIIPGLGGDADYNYREHLAQFVAKEFKVAVVSVNYHCVGDRPQTGAKVFMDDIDDFIFQKRCSEIGLDLSNPRLFDQGKIYKILSTIDGIIGSKKDNKTLSSDFSFKISATFQPTKNEYQNFGIMQAQDIINSLLFIKQNCVFKQNGGGCGEIPVVLIGSSHGGYLAYMVAKIAPWLIDGVIENSAYAKIYWPLIGFGKQIDYTKYYSMRSNLDFKNILIYFSDKTNWTFYENSPNYFSQAREEIRNILNLEHLKVQSQYPKPIYTSYHCIKDLVLAPPSDKTELYNWLEKLDFDIKFRMIKDESEVDGKFIKKLTHGLDMSIKTLISKELPEMLAKISLKEKEIWQNRSITYTSENLQYNFFEVDGKINLKIMN